MAKQSIFGRISTLAKANINAMLDKAEDPQKMLDQMVRDYTNNIREAEAAVAQTIGNLRLLERDNQEDVQAAADWGNKAIAASIPIPPIAIRGIAQSAAMPASAAAAGANSASRPNANTAVAARSSNSQPQRRGLATVGIIAGLREC